jgi:hypothetical protein
VTSRIRHNSQAAHLNVAMFGVLASSYSVVGASRQVALPRTGRLVQKRNRGCLSLLPHIPDAHDIRDIVECCSWSSTTPVLGAAEVVTLMRARCVRGSGRNTYAGTLNATKPDRSIVLECNGRDCTNSMMRCGTAG